MKAMKKKTLLQLAAAFLMVTMASCGDSFKETWTYQVDNPLESEITIKIDDKEYAIPAKTSSEVKLTQGKHTLTYDGSSVNFVTKVNSNKHTTIMNPTLSNYIMYAYFYVRENAKNDDITALYERSSREYQSDAGIVKLPAKVIHTLFIEQTHNDWQFGLDEGAKEAMRSTTPGTKKVLYKIYREDEFKKEHAEELPEGIIFPTNTQKLSAQPVYTFPTEELLCDCDAANEFVKELAERLDQILADPSDIFQAVGRWYYDAISGQSGIDQQCSTRFNPERDDKAYKEAMSKLSKASKFVSNSSSFIVK